MKPDGMKEKRRFPRVLVRALVDYESPGTFLYDYSTDLSEGGLFIETQKPLSQGTTLTLRFTLPNVDRVFQIQGRVAWLNEGSKPAGKLPSGMGIEFMDMDAADRKTLQTYVKEFRGHVT